MTPSHFATVTASLRELGCEITEGAETVRIRRTGRLRACSPVTTQPYPGFPTDAQPVLMAASLKAEGTTVFEERIFEDRSNLCPHCGSMGAHITVEGQLRSAGTERHTGARVAQRTL